MDKSIARRNAQPQDPRAWEPPQRTCVRKSRDKLPIILGLVVTASLVVLSGKIFLTSNFQLLFSNHTHKTETATANMWESATFEQPTWTKSTQSETRTSQKIQFRCVH
jgi:hypothetical protein